MRTGGPFGKGPSGRSDARGPAVEFLSTRRSAPPVSLPEALMAGLAPDGGLYQPHPIPTLSPAELASLPDLEWPARALPPARALLATWVPQGALERIVQEALDFPIPLVPLGERLFVLELFHGPTLAFKDVGARFMARLLAHFRDPASPPLTVLTATSGDTGGAVAHAFWGMEGVRVVVLFPHGQVSPRQERQFSTLHGNVLAVAVQGDFDDCQRIAKEAFQDPELRTELRLTSANSINVGRFLPQSFYYFHAWAEARIRFAPPAPSRGSHRPRGTGDGGLPRPLLVSVPSGNLGNLAAGLLARHMGLSGVEFLAATNANDVVPRFLRTGILEMGPSRRTLSTAMDVGHPSNLERILDGFGGNTARLRRELAGETVSDTETLEAIRRIWGETGYVLDPHSAVGLVALERALQRRPGSLGILLATAHPAKFSDVVEQTLGITLPIPPPLARCLEAPRHVVPLEPHIGALRRLLLSLD